MKDILIKLIQFYRKHISPQLPDMCRYYPTCSQYAIEALEIHGAFKGSLLTVARLLRCNTRAIRKRFRKRLRLSTSAKDTIP